MTALGFVQNLSANDRAVECIAEEGSNSTLLKIDLRSVRWETKMFPFWRIVLDLEDDATETSASRPKFHYSYGVGVLLGLEPTATSQISDLRHNP
jgi:hypothetical protein